MTVGVVPFALQNASHSASVFRIAQSAAFATGGILASNELPVSQQGTPNMSVILGPGRAQIVGTSVSPPAGQVWTTQAQYNAYNDANLSLTVTASNPTNPRIDICALTIQDSAYSGASNTAIAQIVAGTPAVSPVPPSLPANSIALAYIAVAANATTIVTANLTYEAVLPSVVNTATPAAITTATQAIGSKLVVPSSVVVGSGSSSVTTLGAVTFTGASSVSVNGCFTSTFANYLILTNVPTHAASQDTLFRLRVGGVDNQTASAYGEQRIYNSSSTAVAAINGNTTFWTLDLAGSLTSIQNRHRIELLGPALAQATIGALDSSTFASTTSIFHSQGDLYHTQAVAYDGFTIYLASGTISGSLWVYGFNEG